MNLTENKTQRIEILDHDLYMNLICSKWIQQTKWFDSKWVDSKWFDSKWIQQTKWFDSKWVDSKWFDSKWIQQTKWFDSKWLDSKWFDSKDLIQNDLIQNEFPFFMVFTFFMIFPFFMILKRWTKWWKMDKLKSNYYDPDSKWNRGQKFRLKLTLISLVCYLACFCFKFFKAEIWIKIATYAEENSNTHRVKVES